MRIGKHQNQDVTLYFVYHEDGEAYQQFFSQKLPNAEAKFVLTNENLKSSRESALVSVFAEKPSISLEEYYAMLERFDWWYDYSDDHRVWQRERDREKYLKALGLTHPQFYSLWNEYYNFIKNNQNNSLQKPKLVA